jgi:hypothetical protein
MLKKIVAATIVASALGLVAGPAMAENLCLTAHVDVNGTVQDVNQCV